MAGKISKDKKKYIIAGISGNFSNYIDINGI